MQGVCVRASDWHDDALAINTSYKIGEGERERESESIEYDDIKCISPARHYYYDPDKLPYLISLMSNNTAINNIFFWFFKLTYNKNWDYIFMRIFEKRFRNEYLRCFQALIFLKGESIFSLRSCFANRFEITNLKNVYNAPDLFSGQHQQKKVERTIWA